MKLINREELENRLSSLIEESNENLIEEIFDIIEDMPYLNTIELTNGDLRGNWYE